MWDYKFGPIQFHAQFPNQPRQIMHSSVYDFLRTRNRSASPRITELENAPGGRLNKKDGLTRYGDSHVKDKTS